MTQMNSPHLATGQECPPPVIGSLRLYSMRFCPYAQRALLVAAAKGIEYDVVNINLVKKPEFIFTKNPDGKVPTIERNDGKVLHESLIICDYIDEVYDHCIPGSGDASPRMLNPQDPYRKALDRIWIERFGKVSSLDFQLYFPTDLDSQKIQTLMSQLNEQLGIFEDELKRRGQKYFAGVDKPGMLDYMIWPWMERLPSLGIIYKNEASVLQAGRAAHLTLVQWEKAMIEDKAVQESYLPPEIHAEYRLLRRAGGALDYDFLRKRLMKECN